MERTNYTSLESRSRAERSRREAEELLERELRCPQCGYVVGSAYSDSTGHLKVKCKKCKNVFILNFAYFRRQKPYRRKVNTV